MPHSETSLSPRVSPGNNIGTPKPAPDVIDEIDSLIAEQLQCGDTPNPIHSHYCPHCSRDWHGLAITRAMEAMQLRFEVAQYQAALDGHDIEYATSGIIDGYRHDTDSSPIVCPGSMSIGPVPVSSLPDSRVEH